MRHDTCAHAFVCVRDSKRFAWFKLKHLKTSWKCNKNNISKIKTWRAHHEGHNNQLFIHTASTHTKKYKEIIIVCGFRFFFLWLTKQQENNQTNEKAKLILTTIITWIKCLSYTGLKLCACDHYRWLWPIDRSIRKIESKYQETISWSSSSCFVFSSVIIMIQLSIG